MRIIFRLAAAACAVAFVSFSFMVSAPGREGLRQFGAQRGEDWRRPRVYVTPEIEFNPSQSRTTRGPETVPAALAECDAVGRIRIVDCLMNRYSSVSIRRLEACLGTETLPVDLRAVKACLAQGHW